MNKQKSAVYAGSFDPFTIGHFEILKTAAAIFDRLYIAVFINSAKRPMFSMSQRVSMIESAVAGVGSLKNVQVCTFTGPLTDFMERYECEYVIRGARNMYDFTNEHELYQIYRSLNPNISMLVVPAKKEFSHISSSFVREMISYKKDVSNLVPAEMLPELNEALKKKYQE